MKTLLKTLGFTAALLVVLAIGAAVFIGWLFDPNDYKEYVADWVESRTGRSFDIEDDLTLTFFPSLGLETGSLRLGNSAGRGDEPFATADRAVLRVKILPLFLARVELGNLEVDGLRLDLSRDEEGVGNWEDLISNSASDTAASGPAASGGSSRLQNLNIEGVELNEGLVFYRVNNSEVRYIVSELAVETGVILIGQPVRTELSFELVGVEPQFTAAITAAGTALINPSSSLYLAEDLQLGFRVEDGLHEERLAGSLQTTISVSTAERTISVSESQLEASLRNPPLGPAELQFGATASSGRLDLATGSAEVSDLTTNTNGVLASWDVSAGNMLDAPEFMGSLRVENESLAAAFDLLNLPRATDANLDTLSGFNIAASFEIRTLGRELVLSDVIASGLDGEISGALSIDADRNASGHVAIPPFDPRTFLGALPDSLKYGADFSEVDNFAFTAEFNTDVVRQQTSVREVRAEIADTTVSGSFDHYHIERRSEGVVSTSEIDPELVASVFPDLLRPGMTPELLGILQASTEFAYDTVTDELRLDSLDAQALGLSGGGNLTASEILTGSPQLTGTVELQRFDPQLLLGRLGQPPIVTADTSVLLSASINTRLDITGERGIFEDTRLQLDDSMITGDLTVTEFDNPEFDFDLAIDAIDADRYLPPQTDLDGAVPAPSERSIELPTEAMHDLALNGALSIGDLRLAGMQFSEVSTELSIGNGLGAINSARAKLYGGDFEVAIELDARAAVPQLSLEGTAVGLQLDPLLIAIRSESDLSGTGNFNLSLSGIGTGLDEALETTTGNVEFALRDGALSNFNLGHAMCGFWNRIRRLPQPVATNVDFTTFQLMRGSAVVTEGIARTGDLRAEADFMEVTGRGQLDLTTRDINYDLTATLTESTSIPGCETMDRLIGDRIPLEITGNVSAPEPSFDFSEALREGVRNELQDALQDRLQELLSN